MEATTDKDFSYKEHLDVIKSIHQQLKDSDERLKRSLYTDSRRVHLSKDTPKGSPFKENQLAETSLREQLEDSRAQPEEPVETSFEYLKSIKRTEMFRTDKERIDFLVSEIEILNKRIVILECEIDRLRAENEQLKSARKTTAKAGTNKALNNSNTKEIEGVRKEFEEAKKKEICMELQNNLLTEKVREMKELIEKAAKEKEALQVQIQGQNQAINEQAKVLEQFKKVIIAKCLT
eukprot:TRINITY_DN13110_c0_g1_i24.p1 TRINITY_DN13110_c0_g1~~TRINITY_DN13110_c0_g1_i24.p1  ORF type:complete len:235 (-),score=83.53 TRINITY_DN13110_c0_g1_i24:116-820(-)